MRNKTELKRLGIDEIALVKGQKKYCAVLVNLDTGKLIAILEKRTQEELRETLTGWGKEVLEQIEEYFELLRRGIHKLIGRRHPPRRVLLGPNPLGQYQQVL